MVRYGWTLPVAIKEGRIEGRRTEVLPPSRQPWLRQWITRARKLRVDLFLPANCPWIMGAQRQPDAPNAIISLWLQGKILSTKEIGFFPSDAVKPCPCVSERTLLPRCCDSPLRWRWFGVTRVEWKQPEHKRRVVRTRARVVLLSPWRSSPPPPLDVVFHSPQWSSARAAARGIWASPQKITSYYRHSCPAVKIRGTLCRFIAVARRKRLLFYGGAEHAAKARVTSEIWTGCEQNSQFDPTPYVPLLLSGAKTRRLLHSTLVRTPRTTHFTPNK